MTREKRRKLFYALVGLFFVLGAGVVLYADGWRIDILALRAEKVGAIFIRSFPKDAAITIDKAAVPNRAGILSSGTLVSDLFPRPYTVTLTKDGYAPWRESVSVLPSLVTELKYAVLVPASGTPVAQGRVADFAIAGGELITREAGGAISWRGKTVGTGTIVSVSATLKNMIIKNSARGAYVLYDFANGASANLSAALARAGVATRNITSMAIDPYDATKIIVRSSDRIWIYDLTQGALASLDRASAARTLGPSVAVSETLIAWTRFMNATNRSAVMIYDTFAKAVVASSSLAGGTAKLKWITPGTLGVLQNDGGFYAYDTDAGRFQKLADEVQEFEPAEDGTKIATIERRSMEILAPRDPDKYHRFNIQNIASARHLAWYRDMNHLFIQYADRIAFLDLDDAALTNVRTVVRGTEPWYDPQANALHAIDPNQTLVRYDFPN